MSSNSSCDVGIDPWIIRVHQPALDDRVISRCEAGIILASRWGKAEALIPRCSVSWPI